MRAFPIALGILVVGTFLVASAPTSTAIAYCVNGVANTYPDDPCAGVACVGHDQDGWTACVPNVCSEMSCVSPDIFCQFQSDCCQTTPVGSPFYCPETS
jgi:hypothetical protein